jgi:hypothetical protein
LNFINESLVYLNSKYLINEKMSKSEFINFIIYITLEYDLFGSFIDEINEIYKNYIVINFKNLIDIYIQNKEIPYPYPFNENKNKNFEKNEKKNSEKNKKSEKFYKKNITNDKENFIYINFLHNYTKEILDFNIELNNNNNKEDIRTIFNKINFSLKNLKRQSDNFLNMSFRLGELIKIQEKPIKYLIFTYIIYNIYKIFFKNFFSNLKIEELLLFNEDIFNNYKNITYDLQNKLEDKLNNIENLINLLDKNLNIYVIRKFI